MKTTKLSIAIATFNEENNIQKCLDSIYNWAQDIVIVDGSSSDNTTKIIKKYPKVKLINTDNKPMFHINKQMAIDACKGDWILQLDADEIVTPQLRKEIDSLINIPDEKQLYSGYWINRQNFFLSRFLQKGGVYPDSTIRLYQNGKAHLPCKSVHEQAIVEGKVGHLKNDLQHFADPTFSRYLTRNNRYTTLMAMELNNEKLKINAISFLSYWLIKPSCWFLSTYFRHKGFMDGFPGFIFSFFSALRFPISYTKYWELKNSNRQVSMLSDWDK